MRTYSTIEPQYSGMEIVDFLDQFAVRDLLSYKDKIKTLQDRINSRIDSNLSTEEATAFKDAFLQQVRRKKGDAQASFDDTLSEFLTQHIRQVEELLDELSLNSILLSDTLSISNQETAPVEVLHSLISNNPLTHDQVRYLWEILPEKKRQKYFKSGHINANTPIEFQEGISSLNLYRLAAKEKTNHSFVLSADQHKQALSHLTVAQLTRHSQLTYKHTAHHIESTLSTGTQYLSSWYVFLSTYLPWIVGLLTATTIKLSLALAASLAFVGSLSLGLTMAWQQAVDNYRREGALRMKHLINCVKINELKKQNAELRSINQNQSNVVNTLPLSEEKPQSLPAIQPNKDISTWSEISAWLFSPLRRLIHGLKPKQSGISPLAHGIITGFFIAVALVSVAFLFLTSVYTLTMACVVTAFISLLAGAIRYKTVKQERLMESLVSASEKELHKYKKENEKLEKGHASIQAAAVVSPSPEVERLTQEKQLLQQRLEEAESRLQSASISASYVQGQSPLVAHPRLLEQPAHTQDRLDGTVSLSAGQLIDGE